jgi:hypothetical protein
MREPFNWETDRAMSCKALLAAEGISDDQAEMLKLKFADLISQYLPGQEGAVKVSIAEAGSRRWSPVGEKSEVGFQPELPGVTDLRTARGLADVSGVRSAYKDD